MRWKNRVGYAVYSPQELSSMANSGGHALCLLDSVIYDLTDYQLRRSCSTGTRRQRSSRRTDTQLMDSNLFKYNFGQDQTCF